MIRRPHLLYIAFWFPPSRASGVYRALATCNAFLAAGWQVTVITTSERFFREDIGSLDPSLIDEIPPYLDIVRVPFQFQTMTVDVKSMSRFQANFPLIRAEVRRWATAAKDQFVRRFGLSRPKVRERYAGWIQPVVDEASVLFERGPIDHVLATGNPFSSFEAARLIAQEHAIPFSIDYRDPWTIDVFSGERAAVSRSEEIAEERIIDSTVACFHVNEPIAAAYAGKFPTNSQKQIVVINGFDRGSVDIDVTPYVGGPMRFGILGTVNDRWPLDPIFRAWHRREEFAPAGSQLVLAGHLGYFAKSAAPLRELLLSTEDDFVFVGPVEKNHVAEFYSGLDVVIVPVPGSAMVTSGKIYEVMGLGIPFVCVQQAGGGARMVASDHRNGFFADPEEDSVIRALGLAVLSRSKLTSDDVSQTRSEMSAFERMAAMGKMVSSVSTLTPALSNDPN